MSWAAMAKRWFKDPHGDLWYDRWICDGCVEVHRLGTKPRLTACTMVRRPFWIGPYWQTQDEVVRYMNGNPKSTRMMHFCPKCVHLWHEVRDARDAALVEAGLLDKVLQFWSDGPYNKPEIKFRRTDEYSDSSSPLRVWVFD